MCGKEHLLRTTKCLKFMFDQVLTLVSRQLKSMFYFMKRSQHGGGFEGGGAKAGGREAEDRSGR